MYYEAVQNVVKGRSGSNLGIASAHGPLQDDLKLDCFQYIGRPLVVIKSEIICVKYMCTYIMEGGLKYRVAQVVVENLLLT